MVLFGAAVIRFVNLGFTDLQAWDEALYAVRAQVVFHSGLWLDQTRLAIDGLYSSLHPPLYVWGTALAFQVFGISEMSARFVSALSGGITVFVIYYLGKELRSKQTGIIAALLYSFAPFTMFYSRQGQFDALLVLFLSLSVLAIVTDMRQPKPRHAVMAGVFVGCALMTKLFVAFGIPVVYALWIFATNPENRRAHWVRLGILLLVSSVVAAPWHVYMMITHGAGNPLFFFESSAIVQRTFFGIEGNVKPLEMFYYPNQLLVLFPFGACAFLYGAWRSYRSHEPRWMFLTLWFLFFFVVFSLMRTKLAVYLLPMLVPASLLAGRVFEDMSEETIEGKNSRLLVIATLFCVIWSANQFWRDSVKGILSSLASFQMPAGGDANAVFMLSVIVLAGCGIPLIILQGTRISLSRFFPPLVILALFTISATAIVILDPLQFDDGASQLAAFVNRSNVRSVVVAGYERNPQLSYYLKGADIGWRDDLQVRRIVPPADTSLYLSWIQQEMRGEPSSTLLLLEKDKFMRYRVIDPHSFLADGYVRVFESRRYAAFIAGRNDFLASSSNSRRNHAAAIAVQ
jgi:asparagine N-glycosylation enzyme membrane subunit Stt3